MDRFGAEIRLLELPEPAAPRPGEVLLGVRACGIGNWDEFIRTGGWDTGAGPPMPLGVVAAGVIVAVGSGVHGFQPGDTVTTHSLPAGSWAEKFTALAEHRPWRDCARARTAPRSCSSPDHVHRSMPSGAGAPNSMVSTYPSGPGVRSARMAR